MKFQKESHSIRMTRIGTRRGFTLVELLVVIAIVATLVAISFVVFGRVRAAGYRTTVVSNLKQLQLANEMYAGENSGVYVEAWAFDEEGNENPAKWYANQEFLRLFRGEVSDDAPYAVKRAVPEGMLDPVVVRAKGPRWQYLEKSYGLNVDTLQGGGNGVPGAQRQIHSGRLKSSSLTCAFMTGQNPFLTHSGRFSYNGTENNTGNTTTAYRHGGKAIAVFYDGHVDMITMNDMKKFDEEGGLNNPFWRGY